MTRQIVRLIVHLDDLIPYQTQDVIAKFVELDYVVAGFVVLDFWQLDRLYLFRLIDASKYPSSLSATWF